MEYKPICFIGPSLSSPIFFFLGGGICEWLDVFDMCVTTRWCAIVAKATHHPAQLRVCVCVCVCVCFGVHITHRELVSFGQVGNGLSTSPAHTFKYTHLCLREQYRLRTHYTYMQTHSRSYTYIHTHPHTHTHTHIQTHTHTTPG